MASGRLFALCALLLVGVCATASVSDAARVDWASLNATTIAAVAPAEFAALTAAEWKTVNGEACSGLQAAQVRVLGVTGNSSSCVGMPEGCLIWMPAAAMSALQLACAVAVPAERDVFDFSFDNMAAVPLEVVHAITPAQFQQLFSVGYMTPEQVAQITPACCAVMTEHQSRFFEIEDGKPASCRGISAACVAAMPPHAVGALTGRCIADLPDAALVMLTGEEASYLKLEQQLESLSRRQAALLTPDFCSGFAFDALLQLHQGGLHPILGLTPQCWASLGSEPCQYSQFEWLEDFNTTARLAQLGAVSSTCINAFNCQKARWVLDEPRMAPVRAAFNQSAFAPMYERCAPTPKPSPPHSTSSALRPWHIALIVIGALAVLIVAALLCRRFQQKKNSDLDGYLLQQTSQAEYARKTHV